MNSEQPLQLKAGRFKLIFDPATASLRYFCVGRTEVLRGVYAAVRDANWGTVPFQLSELELEQQENSFTLTFTSAHRKDDIHFVWHGEIRGEPNSKITFNVDGEAKSTFKRNRIGFCVLHPMNAAGAYCIIKHTDDSRSEGQFPKTIAPHQPFKDIRSISHMLPNGSKVKVTMQGDTFEMEDQRNWTDASFKTYCTPLELPFPVKVEKGTQVKQQIIIELEKASVDVPTDRNSRFSLRHASKDLPKLGLGTGRQPLNPVAIERLRTLNLTHLRLDLDLQTDYSETLMRVIKEVKSLGCKLELALHLSNDAEPELGELKQKLEDLLPLARALIFHKDEKCTGGKWLEPARSYLPNVPLAGGTNAFFTELNRERPPLNALDLVTYSINPQVHAFDDASLVETLPAQAVTVESAVRFGADRPIIISPITFKMRNNPKAIGDKRLDLEEQIDVRQHTLFGAAWTLGSLKYLFESSAASLTYFETVGKLGVMADERQVYPLYHVFADVGEFRGGEVISSRSNQPLSFEGLILRKERRERILLANFTAEPRTVQLSGLTGSYRGRMLDESTLKKAMLEPEVFRSDFPFKFELSEDFSLKLEPHAVLTLDSEV